MGDGCRVECKSSQLHWDKRLNTWAAKFQNIKFGDDGGRNNRSFDELLLAFHTPRGIHIYHHDLKFGVSSQGVQTKDCGCAVKLRGPSHVPGWALALDIMLDKLSSSGCE